MPFSWLPRRDNVWRQCAGPTARISMNAYGPVVRLRGLELLDPIVSLRPTSRQHPGSHATYVHDTTRRRAGRPSPFVKHSGRSQFPQAYSRLLLRRTPSGPIDATARAPWPVSPSTTVCHRTSEAVSGAVLVSFYFKVLGLLPTY
ncbi:hypothetical protein MUK42_35988 [Musa troglodytarum]|uniref:Uncharacterized protein n=1 Tax=Musa troglodytarum TaxID=320322 RepID=A0A9E7KHL5_9LILI|nr:hypothetical protein MUK42_35988 [Musa troglodytarum]